MKQLISDWLLNTKPEPGVQASQPSLPFAGMYPKMLSDEGKLLLLTQLYLELRLNAEQALRAARADLLITSKAQNRRLWVEQLR
jgi:hypothetical protein